MQSVEEERVKAFDSQKERNSRERRVKDLQDVVIQSITQNFHARHSASGEISLDLIVAFKWSVDAVFLTLLTFIPRKSGDNFLTKFEYFFATTLFTDRMSFTCDQWWRQKPWVGFLSFTLHHLVLAQHLNTENQGGTISFPKALLPCFASIFVLDCLFFSWKFCRHRRESNEEITPNFARLYFDNATGL